jgi:hypothetical protein
MINIKITLYTGIILAASVTLSSCTQNKKSENESEEGDHTEMMDEGHDNGSHDERAMKMGENKTWTPSGNGSDLINSDFHFIAGGPENIKPEVKQVNGSAVLELNADGTPAAFVFHNQYGNIGMIATLKIIDFKGTIRLIHHAKDLSKYEFVSVNGSNMTLGRMINGTEKVFDESKFEASSDWMSLKVTAAGTHYKGYIGDKNITHGHGDKMEKGFVGIMLNGKGKVQIKSVEIAILEDE